MKDSVRLSTPEQAALDFELAGLGSRFLAHMVDLVLIGALLIALWMFLLMGPWASVARDGLLEDRNIGSYGVALVILISFAVLWGYYFFLEGFFQGTTPGKRMLGIRVLREDGLPIGFYESALRNLARAADAFPPPTYLVGGIIMHLDPQGKRLGDMVAGTMVIRNAFPKTMESRTGAAWSARVEQGHSRRPLSMPGGNVTVKQLDLIEQFLHRRESFPLEQRHKLVQSMAAPLWKMSGQDIPQESTLSGIISRDETFLQQLLDEAGQASSGQGGPSESSKEPTFF